MTEGEAVAEYVWDSSLGSCRPLGLCSGPCGEALPPWRNLSCSRSPPILIIVRYWDTGLRRGPQQRMEEAAWAGEFVDHWGCLYLGQRDYSQHQEAQPNPGHEGPRLPSWGLGQKPLQ